MTDFLARALKPDILELIETKDWASLREFLAVQPAPDLADLLDEVEAADQIMLFRLLPRRLADEVFSLLDPAVQNALIERMAQDEARAALVRMSPDDRTALLEELPGRVMRRLLELLPESQRRDALALLSYPQDSIGRLMTTAYVSLQPEWTCREVIAHIRARGSDSETLSMLYVTDEQGRLVDDIPLRRVILADPGTRVSELMDGHYAALNAMQDRGQAVRQFRKYDYFALPVVDSEGVLLGIVTADDILDVEEQEATEDFHRLGTVQPLEIPFSEAGIGLLVRRRSGWLIGLVVVNIFSGWIIASYESVLAASLTLVFFLPLLIATGGNAGSQSATLLVRALATGDVTAGDRWHLLLREILLSVWLGVALAACVFALGWWHGGLGVGLVVGAAMVTSVVASSLMGIVLPFVLLRMKLDPATASVPLITSLADISGLLIYFSIARAVLL